MNPIEPFEPLPYGSDHPHRPVPKPATGELFIDPDILLTAKRFDLQIDFFYSTFQGVATEFGYNRSASTKAYVLSSTSTDVISVVHGDFSVQPHRVLGSSGSDTTYLSYTESGCTSTVVFDGTTFVETANDGTQMSYTAQMGTTGDPVTYSLAKVEDSVGNAHTYNYSGGLLQAIQVPGGHLVTFNYSAGLVSNIQDWSGRKWSFTYDANENLTSYQIPLGCTTEYEYGGGIDSLLLASITDPQGFSTQYTYDDEGRVVSMISGTGVTNWSYGNPSNGWTVQQNPSGSLVTYGYDQYGNATTIMRPEGYTVTYAYNDQRMKVGMTTPAGRLLSQIYDPTSYLLLSETDPLNNVTQYQYDSYGNRTTQIDALGNVTTYLWSGATRLKLAEVDPLGRRTSFTYNSDGTVQTQTDPRGLVTTFNYDSYGNIVSVLYADGGIVTNTYDILNRLTATTDPIGRTTTLAYDAADNVIATTNAMGQVTTRVYTNCLLIAECDPLNHRTSYTYDRYNNVTSKTDGMGNVTAYNFDAYGRPAGFVNPMGDTTTYYLNQAGQLMSMTDGMNAITSFTYDSAGRRRTATDPNGNITTYNYNARDFISTIDPNGGQHIQVYDALGRVISIVDPLGHKVQFYFDAAGQRVASVDQKGNSTTFTYNVDSMLVTTTDANGYNWGNVYEGNSTRLSAAVDPLGNRTSYVYDLASQRLAIVDPLNHRTTFGYDPAGRLVTTMDPKGFVVTHSYDAAGRRVAITNARGFVTTMSYDAANRMVSQMDAAGSVTTTNFDTASRVVSIQDAIGNTTGVLYNHRGLASATYDELGQRTTYTYDSVGNRTSSQDPNNFYTTSAYDALNRLVTFTDEINGVTGYIYDAASRKTVVIDALLNRATTTYDAMDRVIAVLDEGGNLSTLTYDLVGHLIASTDPNVHTTKTGYDPAGRMVTVTSPLGYVTTYAYDAANRKTTIINPNGGITTLNYDERNEITSHIDPMGFATTYGYDANRNTVTVQDPQGNVTTSVFDALDRVGSVTDADNLTTTYQYDAKSRRTGIQNPRGYWMSMAYSARDELTTITDQNGQMTAYGFDNVGNQVKRRFPTGDVTSSTHDGIGNPTLVSYPDGSQVACKYDALGRLVSYVDSGGTSTLAYSPPSLTIGKTDPGGYVQNYLYDPAQQRTQLGDPDLQTRYTAYDADGRIASLLTQDGRVITLQYDHNGNRTTELFHSGWKRTVSYDKNDRVVGISEIGVSGSLEERWTFTYDAFGNRKTVADLMGNFTTLTYDNAYRLLQAATTGPLAHVYNYAYDAAGNRTFSDESGVPTSYSYDPANHLVTSVAGSVLTTYTSDANGNLIGVASGFGLATLTYNYENRLSIHRSPGSVANYVYEGNGLGFMRAQQVDGVVTTNIWDGASQLAQFGPGASYSVGGVTYARMETPLPSPNGTVTGFSLTYSPVTGTETVFLNGIAQDPSSDYSISGSAFTMTSAPAASDQLSVNYFYGTLSGYHRMETPSPATNGSSTVFTLTHSPVAGTSSIYLNGVAQDPGTDFTISGVTITYSVAPATSDKLRVSYFDSAVGLPTGVSASGMQVPVPPVDGVTRLFSFSGQSGTETVYLNGVALRPGSGNDYTISGSLLTLAVAPSATDLLLVDCYSGWATALGPVVKHYQDLIEGEIFGRVIGGTTVNEYGSDALGSLTSYRDGTGTLINKYRFKPYGETLATFGPGNTGPYQFVGRAGYDTLSRIYSSSGMPFRVYDSGLGRFTTNDPISFLGGANLSKYGDNNPVNITDPSGLDPKEKEKAKQLEKFLNSLGFSLKGGRFVQVTKPLPFTQHPLASPKKPIQKITGVPLVDRLLQNGSDQTFENKLKKAARLAEVSVDEIVRSWKTEGGALEFDPEGYAVLVGGNTAFNLFPFYKGPQDNAVTYGGVVHIPNWGLWDKFIGKNVPIGSNKENYEDKQGTWRAHEHAHLYQIKHYYGGSTISFLIDVAYYFLLYGHDRSPLEIDADNRGGIYKVITRRDKHGHLTYSNNPKIWHNPSQFLPKGFHPEWMNYPPYNATPMKAPYEDWAGN